MTGERISAIGSDIEILALADENTEVVNLDGALVIPSFQDAHNHPVSAGIELLQCDLTNTETAEESLGRVAAYAASHPDVEWILGAGWSMDQFPGGTPTRQALDVIVPDRPVLLTNRDHHGMWANTRAFELAGIDATTPDPDGGRLERESDGYPAGTVHEYAMDLFEEARPPISAELAYAGLLRAQEEMFRLGVTGWQDAHIGELFGSPDTVESYRRAVEEGTLRMQVVGAQWWEKSQGIEQVQAFIELRAQVADESPNAQFVVNTIKIMVDGVAENFTAAMNAPYLDEHGHRTDNSGFSYMDPELLKTYVTALDAAGFQVHFHALGDRAVQETLDAVEAAREANGPSANRHHLAHLQLVADADMHRFAELDVAANMQMLWACHEPQMDDLALPFMPSDAESRTFPFGELHTLGTRLVAGSDWPVSSADPIAAIHIAVNRASPHGPQEPLGGDVQKLDLATALTAYTAGSAYANHRDHDTGALAAGYLANLVVLHPNPFELAPTDIHTTTVQSTWVRGEQVYAAASARTH
ncbi:amidohydrolase [Leifsonia sp. YAF41]|uniref:amidohydrolase n=1 Tax=Leifsonia sp. YAF41 TaxID=3233086 RepID=UPI003F9716E7